jgi:hypothetical protein
MSALRDRKRQRNTRPALESLDLRIAPSGVAAGALVAGAQASPMYVIRGEPPTRPSPTPINQPYAGASPAYRIKGEPPTHPSPTPINQPYAGASPAYRIKGEPPTSNPPSPVIMPYAR